MSEVSATVGSRAPGANDYESLNPVTGSRRPLQTGEGPVGKLFYGSDSQPAELPDRVLAHVKAVVASKLRRGESFTLSWQHPDGVPGGRSTLWINPSIPLRFVFTSPEGEMLDPEILKSFAAAANSTAGLVIQLADYCDEPRTPAARHTRTLTAVG